jgi:hypothetical protein
MIRHNAATWFALLALGCMSQAWSQSAAPTCYPDLVYPAMVRTTVLPQGVSTRYTHAAAWTCAIPTGHVNELWLFSWSSVSAELTAAAVGVFDESAARARCAQECQPATVGEIAWPRQWATPHRARAVVSPSGTATTRPVYALNPDGSRQTIALSGARVAVGAACKLSQRLGSTTFHSVEGQPNVATADATDVLGPVFAICSVVAPIGVNL